MEVGKADTPTVAVTPGRPGTNTSGSAIGNGSDVATTGPGSVTSPQQPGLLPAASASAAIPEAIILASESSSISGVRATTTTAAAAAPPSAIPKTTGVNKSVSSPVTSLVPTKMSATTAVTPAATTNNNNNNTNSGQTVKSCAGCGARIVDRFLLHAMDRYWHTGCLKCSCCQAQLGEIGTSCFTKAGMILCKNDYIRLFGSSGTCAACSQNIPAQEFVMRTQSNVYHVNCFTCVTCHQRLVPGDRYSIVNGSLICEQDYPKVLKGHTTIPIRPTHKVNNNNTNINNRNEADMLHYY